MTRCNWLAVTSKCNASKEPTASIFRIFLYQEKRGAKILRRFITTCIYQTTRRHVMEDCHLHIHYCENLQSHTIQLLLLLLQMALQPGVDLGLLYNVPPDLSTPCSVFPFVHTHLSQVHGHIFQPSHFWSSTSSCCIQLSVHLFFGIAVSCILSI